jgi:hypothetical protein
MAGSRGSMSGFWLKFAPLSVVLCLCLAAFAPSAVAQRGGVRKPAAKKKQDAQKPDPPPIPAYTPSPLQPLPLDQLPAVAPKVSYEGGKLSIVAHNCTLADVLRAVKKQLGADLDIPPNANERVVADLGPGTPRQVIADLLNGTHFNYVIVGSSTDPAAVQSLALTPKTGGSTETASAAPSNRLGTPGRVHQPGMPPPAPGVTPPADADDDGTDPPEEATDQPDGQDEQQAQQQGEQNPAQQTPKTPEQLLQELQRQQQQMQQQQGQQPSQSAQPPQGNLFPEQPPTSAPNKPD